MSKIEQFKELYGEDIVDEIHEHYDLDQKSSLYRYPQLLTKFPTKEKILHFLDFFQEKREMLPPTFSASFLNEGIRDFELHTNREDNHELIEIPEDVDQSNPELNFENIDVSMQKINELHQEICQNVSDSGIDINNIKHELSEVGVQTKDVLHYAKQTNVLLTNLQGKKERKQRLAEYEQVEELKQVVTNTKTPSKKSIFDVKKLVENKTLWIRLLLAISIILFIMWRFRL